MKKPAILTDTCRCKNKTQLELKNVEISMSSRSKPITFDHSVPVCSSCHLPLLDEQLQQKLQERTKELVREREGLLTANEIKEMREALKMSLEQFGEYLRILPLSVYLWEKKGRLQNRSTDELIRVKCDPKYVQAHQEEITRVRKKRDPFATNKESIR